MHHEGIYRFVSCMVESLAMVVGMIYPKDMCMSFVGSVSDR